MRKKASIEEFIEAGAYYRLYKAIARECALKIVRLVHGRASDSDKLLKCFKRVEAMEVKIGLENYLREDYPEMPNDEFFSFFYGSLNEIRNDIDVKINEKSREIVNEILKRKE